MTHTRTRGPGPDGRSRTRTCDIYDVNVALYQLSYATSETAEIRANSPNLSRDTPPGTRPPVSAVRGRYPRPLDDRGMQSPPFQEGQNSKRGARVAQPLSTFLETDVSWEMQGQAIVVIDRVSRAVLNGPIRRSRGMQVAEKMTKLNPESVRGWMSDRKGWKRRSNRLTKEFVFKKFRDSIVFVNRVATIADSRKHHPDIDLRGGTVTLTLSTEAVGGISEKDLDLAEQIDFATSWNKGI